MKYKFKEMVKKYHNSLANNITKIFFKLKVKNKIK